MNSLSIRQLILSLIILCSAFPIQLLAQKPTSGIVNTQVAPPVHPLLSLESYRQLLLDTLSLTDSIAEHALPPAQRLALLDLSAEIEQFSDDELQLMLDHGPPIGLLQDRLQGSLSRLEIARANESVAIRQIEFPEPETTIAACANLSSTAAFEGFVSFYTVREILVGLTWPCLETVLGENDSSACTAFAVVDAGLEAANKFLQACLQEQRDAYLDAILDTEENIADHLNEFVDATTSSRASQDSVDDLQDDVTDTLNLLSDFQTSLDSDLSDVENQLDEVLTELNDLIDNAISLASTANDIQFRVQENQIDVEDAQIRAADAQETAEEIRTDTQSIIASVSEVQTSLGSLEVDINNGLAQSRKAALVATLADPNSQVIRYQLPIVSGGELERVRELVIQTIISFGNLGVKTTTALSLVAMGDQAYNDQGYLLAYGFFAEAYQQLTVTGAPAKPKLGR